MSTARRLSWAVPVKGLAIALVVAFHVTLYLDPAGVDVVLGRVKALFELFPMPAFFLVAGLAAGSHPNLSLGSLWWRRVYPVVYVYVLWSLLRTVFYLLVPGLQGGLGDLPADDWRTVLLLPVWPSSSYWFLYALALFMVLRWLVARVPAGIQLAVAAVVSAAFSSGIVSVGNVGWTRIGSLFVFFLAGALLSAPLKRAVDRSRPWHVALLAAGVLVVTAALLLGLRRVPPVALVGQVLAVATGVVALAHLPAGRVRDVLTTLGEQSFRVYLVHLFPIVLICAGIRLLEPAWPRVVDAGVQAVVALLVLWLSVRFSVLSGRWRWLYAPPEALLPARLRRRPAPRHRADVPRSRRAPHGAGPVPGSAKTPAPPS
ncbi:acyltransferase [Kineococcus glutinatus]|uniref:Acyltransferase 3 domain-containing protein n=1 Tax=Kineococcus glutinatus TaxID=1070872 RepID=A0ABP9HCK8_9ACTN